MIEPAPKVDDWNWIWRKWLGRFREIANTSLSTKYYDTLDDAVADVANISVDDVIILKERTAGNGGGAMWDAVDATTVTENERDIVTGSATISFQLRVDNGNMVVSQFGATSSTSVPITTGAIQAALDIASTNKGCVYGEPGAIYNHSMLTIKNGTSVVDFTQSVLTPDGSTSPTNLTTEAAVVLDGALIGGAPVDGCRVSLVIDMKNGDRTAILGDGCINCVFEKNKIYGFTNDATHNHRGIRLQEASSYNRVINNEITGFAAPTQRGLLIDVYGSLTGFLNFGNFFTGTSTNQPTPAVGNIISNNVIKEGSYAVSLQGCEYTDVSNNVFTSQNHRGMWVGNGSWYNSISDNTITDFTSSAILLGYSCSYNLIANNHCRNEGAVGIGGESVININTGSSYNLIIGNLLDAPVNYSVYVATDSNFNVVDGNYSKNAYVAAFGCENDWKDTLPTNNFYGRPNYADPTDADPSATSWTFNDIEGNVFQNNVIHSGYTGRNIAAFYLGQVENSFSGATPTDHKDTVIRNNKLLTMTNVGYGLYIHEHVASQMSGLEITGNSWPDAIVASTADFAGADTASSTLDVRDVGVEIAYNNGKLDELINGTAVAFTDADTTPSILNWSFFIFSNTGATSVTDFDDATEGKEIILRGDTNTTIVYTSGLIRPKGLANVTGMNANSLIAFKSVAGIWYEMWRNF